METDDLVEADIETVKEVVAESNVDIDLDRLMEMEQERHARDELLDWLEEKKRRQELLQDEDRIEELLSHIEHAYRTAAISEDTYRHAKRVNRELLE